MPEERGWPPERWGRGAACLIYVDLALIARKTGPRVRALSQCRLVARTRSASIFRFCQLSKEMQTRNARCEFFAVWTHSRHSAKVWAEFERELILAGTSDGPHACNGAWCEIRASPYAHQRQGAIQQSSGRRYAGRCRANLGVSHRRSAGLNRVFSTSQTSSAARVGRPSALDVETGDAFMRLRRRKA
jgi:hypothetical protein